MKKKLSTILGRIAIASIFGACIITNKAGDPCIWNYVLLAVSFCSGCLSAKLTPKQNNTK